MALSPFPAPPQTDAVVVVPTYNEAANVETVIRRVLRHERFAVLVVDDGSPDGTATLVRRLQEEHPARVGLIEREGKLGLGTAYLTGFRAALDAGFAYVCEMDADLSHNPDDLPRLLAACEPGTPPEASGEAMLDDGSTHLPSSARGADVAVGSRYVGGVRVMNWPLGRLVLSYGAGVYTRAITRLPVMDVTAGFACFRREVLETINFDLVTSNGYSFQIEMKYRAWKLGFRLVEVPIVFTERTEGQSKMTGAIVREATTKVWRLRFASLFGRL